MKWTMAPAFKAEQSTPVPVSSWAVAAAGTSKAPAMAIVIRALRVID